MQRENVPGTHAWLCIMVVSIPVKFCSLLTYSTLRNGLGVGGGGVEISPSPSLGIWRYYLIQCSPDIGEQLAAGVVK